MDNSYYLKTILKNNNKSSKLVPIGSHLNKIETNQVKTDSYYCLAGSVVISKQSGLAGSVVLRE